MRTVGEDPPTSSGLASHQRRHHPVRRRRRPDPHQNDVALVERLLAHLRPRLLRAGARLVAARRLAASTRRSEYTTWQGYCPARREVDFTFRSDGPLLSLLRSDGPLLSLLSWGRGSLVTAKEQHRAFPRGPPPQYYPGSIQLNFAVRMGSGEPG